MISKDCQQALHLSEKKIEYQTPSVLPSPHDTASRLWDDRPAHLHTNNKQYPRSVNLLLTTSVISIGLCTGLLGIGVSVLRIAKRVFAYSGSMFDRTVCIKCKGEFGPPAIFVRKDDPPLCKTCFLAGCMHKFRASFGKANIVRNREAVALAFSGGYSSLAMLTLAKMCQARTESRKLRFDPTVVCLYDVEQPYPEKQEKTMRDSGFEYKIVRTDEIPLTADNSVEEMLRWRRLQQLMVYTSHVLGFKYLLVGDNASQLAVYCLSGIAQGRGGTVATELGFADTRYHEVTVLRPMYNFLAKEVALLLHFAGLEAVVETSLTAQQNLATLLTPSNLLDTPQPQWLCSMLSRGHSHLMAGLINAVQFATLHYRVLIGIAAQKKRLQRCQRMNSLRGYQEIHKLTALLPHHHPFLCLLLPPYVLAAYQIGQSCKGLIPSNNAACSNSTLMLSRCSGADLPNKTTVRVEQCNHPLGYQR
ncbi:Cytoplasmic tRNA 2-thiolation protein 2 [Taenia crassiceps]|uniref:Cytoplasmic tRNA 2-thiolation protein 2 n=1 Tax=Taenia crassiceps TaxID=6207 RepID=A0ABR4QA48_9CEST